MKLFQDFNKYHLILADDLKYVHQALLQSAKRAGSLDNITVIVVFLTPPIEIASRNSLLSHRVPNGLLVNNMDPNNPFSSNPGQFDVNAAFIKQQQQQLLDTDIQAGANFEFDDNRLIFGKMTRNGKHEDGDGNDEDYDYGDLGPETDVDTCEDMPDIAHFPTSTSNETSPECEANVDPSMNVDSNKDDNENDDYLNRDNANVHLVEPMMVNDDGEMDNRYVSSSDRDVRDADDKMSATRDNDDDDDNMCIEPGMHTIMDDDESPPSPRTTSKCTLSVVRTRLCVAMVYGYACRAVSNLFASFTNYISSSLAAHVFGLRRK